MSRARACPVRGLVAGLLAGGALSACSAAPPAGAPPVGAPAAPTPAVTTPPTGSPRAGAPGSTASPSSRPALGPLTGLPAAEDAARRPVVAVPVVVGSGRPAPSGLQEADLAYVAFPGPERQRVVALYQSRAPERVGPVVPTRPVDAKLVGVFGAVLQYAGGPASFVRQLDQAEIVQWSSLTRSTGFTRDAAGLLHAAPAAAREATGASAATAGVLPFSSAAAADGAGEAREIEVRLPAQPPLTLRYDPDDRRWEGSLGALPVAATNVVLQEVAYEQLVLPQSGGATERDPVLLSTDGDATVLRPSGASAGSWNRRGRDTLTSYLDADGVPVRLAPGTTRVLLVPEGTEVDGLQE